jgi:hypothetical protein
MPEIANEEKDDKPMDCWDTLFSGKPIHYVIVNVGIYPGISPLQYLRKYCHK